LTITYPYTTLDVMLT